MNKTFNGHKKFVKSNFKLKAQLKLSEMLNKNESNFRTTRMSHQVNSSNSTSFDFKKLNSKKLSASRYLAISDENRLLHNNDETVNFENDQTFENSSNSIMYNSFAPQLKENRFLMHRNTINKHQKVNLKDFVKSRRMSSKNKIIRSSNIDGDIKKMLHIVKYPQLNTSTASSANFSEKARTTLKV